MGQTVVLDSTNLDEIIKDATGEGITPLPKDSSVQTTIEAAKEAIVPVIDPATDDIEGEDGLTPHQRRELTAKMQIAIGKKHRQAREAEEFATEQYNTRRLAEERNQALERENRELKAAAQPKVEELKEPQRANFQTQEAYDDAVISWKVDKRYAEKQEAERKAAEEKQEADIMEAGEARIARAYEIVPDYQEVIQDVSTKVPPAISEYMKQSELFAEIGYYFAKNPGELERLGKLTAGLDLRTKAYHRAAWRQLVEIGKIESKLSPFAPAKVLNGQETESTNGITPSPETGQTPSPRASAPVIRPLSQVGVAQVEKSESDMDAKEALRAWAKKKHVNLTRRSRH
jgi:hypothetical protein